MTTTQMVHDAGVHADGQRRAAIARAVVGRAGRRRGRVHAPARRSRRVQRGRRRRGHATSQSVSIRFSVHVYSCCAGAFRHRVNVLLTYQLARMKKARVMPFDRCAVEQISSADNQRRLFCVLCTD